MKNLETHYKQKLKEKSKKLKNSQTLTSYYRLKCKDLSFMLNVNKDAYLSTYNDLDKLLKQKYRLESDLDDAFKVMKQQKENMRIMRIVCGFSIMLNVVIIALLVSLNFHQ